MYGARATSQFKESGAAASTVLVEVLTDSSGNATFDVATGSKAATALVTDAEAPVSFTFSSENVIPQIEISGATADKTYLFLVVS